MNQHTQMHFDGMYPTEADSHGSTNYGDDIGKENASSTDDIDIQEDHDVDVVMPAGDQTGLSVDVIDPQVDQGDDAVVESNEQGDDIGKHDVLNTDDIELLDDHGVDAANESSEQAAFGVDDIGPQDDHVDDAATDSMEQKGPSDGCTSSSSLQ